MALPKSEATDALLDGSAGDSLARRLAAVDKEVRDGAVAEVRAWMRRHPRALEGDYMRLWKALYFCVWLSDKVPIQQELMGTLASLIGEAHGPEQEMLLARCFFRTVQREWLKLDKWRVDKYLSLIRKVLAAVMHCVANKHGFRDGVVTYCNRMLLEDILAQEPNGIRMHIAEIWLEEACRACPRGTTEQLRVLLQPWYAVAMQGRDATATTHAISRVLDGVAGLAEAVAVEQVAARASGAKLTESAYPFAGANFAAVAWDIFQVAASSATRAKYRPAIFAVHKRIDNAAKKLGLTYRLATTVRPEDVIKSTALASESIDGLQCGAAPVVVAAETAAAAAAAAAAHPKPSKRGREADDDGEHADKGAAARAKRSRDAPTRAIDHDDDDDDDDDDDEDLRPVTKHAGRTPKKAAAAAAAAHKSARPDSPRKAHEHLDDVELHHRGLIDDHAHLTAKATHKVSPVATAVAHAVEDVAAATTVVASEAHSSPRRVRIVAKPSALDYNESIQRLRRSAHTSASAAAVEKPLKGVLHHDATAAESQAEKRRAKDAPAAKGKKESAASDAAVAPVAKGKKESAASDAAAAPVAKGKKESAPVAKGKEAAAPAAKGKKESAPVAKGKEAAAPVAKGRNEAAASDAAAAPVAKGKKEAASTGKAGSKKRK